MILSNPHTHTELVDGKSPARDSVERALELGFESLGFSEHAFQGRVDSLYALTPEKRAKYVEQIRSLQKEYAGRLRIWLGMEVDRVSPEDASGLDYFIGANHYLIAPDGSCAGVDGDPDRLEAFVNAQYGGSWDSAIEQYYSDYAEYIEQRRPTFIAHFDLIRKGNLRRSWFKEDGALLTLGKEAMRRMIKSCALMEVNTGGMVRSGQLSPYPIQPLLNYWHELGGEVIPASDCHNCLYLDGAFDAAEDAMRRAGYSEYRVLGRGDELIEVRAL